MSGGMRCKAQHASYLDAWKHSYLLDLDHQGHPTGVEEEVDVENNHLHLSVYVLTKMDHSGLFLPGGPFEPGGPAEPAGPFGPVKPVEPVEPVRTRSLVM